jgi:hypothetical protein
MITIRHIGDFRNTERFLTNAKRMKLTGILSSYGQRGVSALSLATPVDTGKTASSWRFSILLGVGYYRVSWFNDHIEYGASPAILIQYGHGTKGGGYVRGTDYINPAIRPILDGLAEELWKEVCSL